MEDFENENKITEQEEYLPEQSEEVVPDVACNRGLPFWLGILVGVAAMAAAAVAVFFLFIRPNMNQLTTAEMAARVKSDTIQSYINNYFLWDVPDTETINEAMEEGMADGIMESLGDKYALYYTPDEYQAQIESASGSYAGIGVSIIMNDAGNIEVYKVFKNTPAKEAGICVGDYIVEADGVKDFEDTDQLVAVVRGLPGTTVDLVIERNGKQIPMTIERAMVETETIEYRMLEDNIGYILIEKFETATVNQFSEAIDALEDQGAKSLIFDLRYNPGGDYNAVVAMCDRVLPEGVIMTVRDKAGNIKTEVSDNQQYVDLPLAVLINEYSASASEVFTGAIQDYGMATIIGTTSFGKGIVQSIFSLPDGSGMKFTTQEYFTPSGDSINGIGIKPDIEVELPEEVYDDGELEDDEDTQLQKAIEVLSK